MSHITRLRWRGKQRAGRHRSLADGIDELGDVAEPVVVEVVGGAITQELARHEQRSLRVRRPTASMGGRCRGRSGRWSRGAAITPHGRWQRQILLLASIGSVAALATGEAEWRGALLPAGAVQATRASRRSARTRRVSAIGVKEWRGNERWKKDFDTPYLAC